MASKLVSIVGLPKLLKKLDDGLQVGPESAAVLRDLGNLGRTTLMGYMPTDWNRPRQIRLETTEMQATVSLPRYPYVFFERGSAYPSAQRQRRTVGRRSAASLRIRPRRYLARTRRAIRQALPDALRRVRQRVEKAWVA